MKELPLNKRIDLLSEIKNLRKHVEKWCVSGIPTGAGTENNERLFKSKIKVAKAVSTVLFYLYNSHISNGNRGKVAFYSPLPLQKSSSGSGWKSLYFFENEENTRTDPNYIMEIRKSIMQLYNAILQGRGKCIRWGFWAKHLPTFISFPERPMNWSSHEENIRCNLAFSSNKNKPSCSWWRFIFCQHSFTSSITPFLMFWERTFSSESHS